MDSRAKLNKYRTNLTVSGTGIILFGVWDVVKLIMETIMGTDGADEMIRREDGGVSILSVTILILVMALILYIHFRIGRAAIANARGEARTNGYLVGCVIIAAITVLGFFLYGYAIATGTSTVSQVMISAIVDVTFLLNLIDMIRATMLIRKYEKAVD